MPQLLSSQATWPYESIEKDLVEKWDKMKSRSSLLRAGSEWLHRTLPDLIEEQRNQHRKFVETTDTGKRYFAAILNSPQIQQETPEATHRSVRHHLLFSEFHNSVYKKLELIRRAVDHLISIETEGLLWPEACALLLIGKLLIIHPLAGERLPKPLRGLNPKLHLLEPNRVREVILALLTHERDLTTNRVKLELLVHRLYRLLELWPKLMAARKHTHRYGPFRIDPLRYSVRIGLKRIAPRLASHRRILAVLALAQGQPVSRGILARKARYARKRKSDPERRANRRLRRAICTLNEFLAEHCIRLRIILCGKRSYKLIHLHEIEMLFVPDGLFHDIGRPIICSHGNAAPCGWRRYGDIPFIAPPGACSKPGARWTRDCLAIAGSSRSCTFSAHQCSIARFLHCQRRTPLCSTCRTGAIPAR